MKMAEDTLGRLVVTKTIFAKLDRLSGLIRFDEPKNADAVIEAWSQDFQAILEQLVKVNHLIAKEEMLHALQTA
jgi:26S proteasome regulatory subunit N5